MSTATASILTLIKQEKYKLALKKINKNSRITEDEKFYLLGICHGHLGELNKSINFLQFCLAANPNHMQAYAALVQTYTQIGEDEKAEKTHRQALSIKPNQPYFLNGLAALLNKKGEYQEAITLLQTALKIRPDARELHTHIGHAYYNTEAYEKAYEHQTYVIERTPNNEHRLLDYGYTLLNLGKYEQARQCFSQCIKLKPDFITPYFYLAKAYDLLGDEDNALKNYRQTIALCQQHPTDKNCKRQQQLSEWMIGILQLRRGEFEAGWKRYEQGLHERTQRRLPSLAIPFWNGQPLTGKTLLITAEQGIGDEIMFASCLQYFKHDAQCIILECEKRLLPLYRRSFDSIEIIPMLDYKTFDHLENLEADYFIPIASLAAYFRAETHRPTPYLKVDAKKREHWQHRFNALGEGLKIGLSWKGGGLHETKIQRSIPLNDFHPLLALPHIHWINCQYGEHEKERETVFNTHGIKIHEWPESNPVSDPDDFCAKLAALDLIISIDNSTVHFAGAVGLPTWVLLPCSAEWRWGNDTSDTYWYPSVQLFRQTQPHDWEPVLQTIKQSLQEKLSITQS